MPLWWPIFFYKLSINHQKRLKPPSIQSKNRMSSACVCVMEKAIKIEIPYLPPAPPVHSDPRNGPFPRACHVCLNNSVSVSLKADPRCADFFTPSQTWFRGSNKSYSSLAKCLKCILSHERENSILSLQCEISDMFLLVWSAVLLIHTQYCWHKTKTVWVQILEEVRRHPRSDSTSYFVNFIFFMLIAKTLFEANSCFKETKPYMCLKKGNKTWSSLFRCFISN